MDSLRRFVRFDTAAKKDDRLHRVQAVGIGLAERSWLPSHTQCRPPKAIPSNRRWQTCTLSSCRASA